MILIDTPTLAHLQSWQGRSDTLHDDISAAPLRGWMATLDRPLSDVQRGTEVPPWGIGCTFCRPMRKANWAPMAMLCAVGFCHPFPCHGACGPGVA